MWIIKKDPGICIFHKNYAAWEIEPQQFSAFLSRIYKLNGGISETCGVEFLELQDMSVLYSVVADLFFILSMTKDEEVEGIRQKMTEVSQQFTSKFKDQLQHWTADVRDFKWFGPELDRILGRTKGTEVVEIPVKLPENMHVSLTTEELGVLLCIDGKTSSASIAKQVDIPSFKLMLILKSLAKKKLIQVKKVISDLG